MPKCRVGPLAGEDFAASGRCGRVDRPEAGFPTHLRRRSQLGKVREIDEILAQAHALAVFALEQPDTS